MQSYLALYKQGIPTCAVRYEDLVADPHQIATSIFQKCGLPIAEVANACKVFEKDSQSGSNLSQEKTRKNDKEEPDILEIRQKIYQLLNKHPEIKTPNFIVPDTLARQKST